MEVYKVKREIGFQRIYTCPYTVTQAHIRGTRYLYRIQNREVNNNMFEWTIIPDVGE